MALRWRWRKWSNRNEKTSKVASKDWLWEIRMNWRVNWREFSCTTFAILCLLLLIFRSHLGSEQVRKASLVDRKPNCSNHHLSIYLRFAPFLSFRYRTKMIIVMKFLLSCKRRQRKQILQLICTASLKDYYF